MSLLLLTLPTEQSPILPFINFIMVLIVVIISWPARRKPFYVSKQMRRWSWFLLFLCMIFSFYGMDWFHYYEKFLNGEIKVSELELGNLQNAFLIYEVPYYYIAYFVRYNYLLFRLVIWGTALLLYFLTMKRLRLNRSTFILYFTIITLLFASYGRVTLAWAFGYYGFSFVVKPIEKKTILSIAIGIALIALSTAFHKTAILLPIVMSLSLVKFNKVNAILFLIAFPILVIIVNTYFLPYVMNLEQGDITSINVGYAQHWFENEESEHGIASQIRYVLLYSMFYLCLFLVLISLFKKGIYKRWPYRIQRYANSILWTILFSTMFLFAGEELNTYTVYYRFLLFASFPMTVLMTYVARARLYPKLTNIITLLATGYTFYTMLYCTYCAFYY